MGWVRRPWFSRSKSGQSQSSLTVWLAKNSGVVRFAVASHDTALAPFSQNSKEDVCFGSGHAQTRAIEPVRLVHGQKTMGLLADGHLAANRVRHGLERAPTRGGGP